MKSTAVLPRAETMGRAGFLESERWGRGFKRGGVAMRASSRATCFALLGKRLRSIEQMLIGFYMMKAKRKSVQPILVILLKCSSLICLNPKISGGTIGITSYWLTNPP